MASSSPNPSASQPYVVEDCRGVVQVLSDGTIVRSPAPIFPVSDHDDGSVEWQDAVYDTEHNLGLRMFKPRNIAAGEGKKLPVLVYFHGGGFCIGSYSWPNFHACCLRLAGELPAVVLSFDYRLAPEHRLPACHDDAATALLWLREQFITGGEPWIAEAADSSKVFISGESAGGNISHHMAVRFGTAGLNPVRIRGYILLMPGFCSVEPTQSELDTPDTAFLNRDICERYLRLAVPVGGNKDHPLINPFGLGSPSLEAVDVGDMLVVVAERDLLKDKDVEYAERMKAMGKSVELVEFAGEEHAFFALKPWCEAADKLIRVIREIIERVGAGSGRVGSCP